MLQRLIPRHRSGRVEPADVLTPETQKAPGARPEYTYEDVARVATAQLVDLEPPVTDAELTAIHGMVNGIATECPTERALRFDIVVADGQRVSSMSSDPRNRALNAVLGEFRLG